MTKTKYLRCVKCGNYATPTKTEVGTSTKMRCSDCSDTYDPLNMPQEGFAAMCRQCCPTNHKTMMYK